MTHPVADPIAYLRGPWSITRTLTDADLSGTFTGKAWFTPDASGLAYEEQGVLTLPHWSGDSHRRLHYARSSPGLLRVTFEDTRFFHNLDLRTGHCTTHHPCPPDAYEGTFTITSADEWHQEWKVQGPRKAQHIASTFSRCTAPD